jgi:Flp pilus assembly protein TadD
MNHRFRILVSLVSLLSIILLEILLWDVPVYAGSLANPAPVYPDYQDRNQIVASYEGIVAQHPSFLSFRLLGSQYLKRFRELRDPDDLLRAETTARQSLMIQPQPASNQGAAKALLASTLVAQHRFQEALQTAQEVERLDPNQPTAHLQLASILMEIGDYSGAETHLRQAGQTMSLKAEVIQARYLELTGHLAEARQTLELGMEQIDQRYTNSAELRSWFHLRGGDLAFLAGDLSQAETRYREALEIYPKQAPALTGLARLYAAQHRWTEALEVATQGSDLWPGIDTLSYKAATEQALGDEAAAKATANLIEVIAHLSQAKGIYDRALALHYIEAGIHLPEALDIAHQEVASRDDIYAEDTLAWAAAANQSWEEAETAIHKALRYGTEDPMLHFHAGIIAFCQTDTEAARQHLTQALQMNPSFHYRYADQARDLLTQLTEVDIPRDYSSLCKAR